MGEYLGFGSTYKDAELIFIGLPFDGTASFRAGSRFAPTAIRKYSDGLETYSPYQNKDLNDEKICDYGDLELPFGNSESVINIIERKTEQIIRDSKKILACGGEHLVSYPLVKAYHAKYPNLKIIHIDAHTDLRDSYLGEKYSHASVIKLITDFIKPDNIYQYGIRSGLKEEFEWGRKNTNFFPFSVAELRNNPVDKDIPIYISLDLDVLDPSCMPGTGTPEPGGVMFSELLNALLSLKEHNIVGADVVELAPDYDMSGASTMVAAKIIREMALLMI